MVAGERIRTVGAKSKSMSKQAAFIAIILCCTVMLCCIGTGKLYGAKPVVKWVYMADAEPINWQENGVAKGLEVDIVEHIFNKLGIQVLHQFYPWARAQLMIKQGLADGMMTTPTPQRFEYAIFGKENVLPNYWNIFIKKGNERIAEKIPALTKLEDLRQFDLLDFIGNGWTDTFMNEGYSISRVAKVEQIPFMLANGRHDLAINSSTWINWWAEKQEIKDKLQEFEINWLWTRFHFVFMVSRKSVWSEKGLIRALDEEMKKMKETGIWTELLKKYKNPHGYGKPFLSHLDQVYEKKHGFYREYEKYPVYTP